MKKQIGRVSVYVMHSEGFDGRLRPAYDAAATADGMLTFDEVSELRSRIAKFIMRCESKRLSKAAI